MARAKKEAAPAITTVTVNSAPGLNLRKSPARTAPVVRILADGEQIAVADGVEAPTGWLAVDGGYVMTQFVK
jgi:hypothetical protein